MLVAMGAIRVAAFALLGALAVGVAHAGGGAPRTSITVWATPPPQVSPYGGLAYGGYTAPTGAMITERREVDVAAAGEVRITGIAATVDPATVQLRSLTDPGGIAVTEQRFVPGANTPDEILSRHVGDSITIVTPKGEVTGVLRSVDQQALVIEAGTADQRTLQVLRRDGYVQDIRMPAASRPWRSRTAPMA
jgi:hypothetical protein